MFAAKAAAPRAAPREAGPAPARPAARRMARCACGAGGAHRPPDSNQALLRHAARPCPTCAAREAGAAPIGPVDGPLPAAVQSVLRAPGEPLDAASRRFFEPRLGEDLSAVRVHRDAAAGRSAQAVDALAYAVGPHIAFAPGRFAPGSAAGRRLLAHELVHVAQQMRGSSGRRSGPAHEREAAALAGHLAAGGSSIRAVTAAAPGLARADAPYRSPYNEDLAREMYARLVAFRAEQGAAGNFVKGRFTAAVADVFDEEGKRIARIERLNIPGAQHAEELIHAEVRKLGASGRKVGYTVLMIDADPCFEICTPLLKAWRGDPVTGSLRVVTPMRPHATRPDVLVSARTANETLKKQQTVHVELDGPPPKGEAGLYTRRETSVIRLKMLQEPPGATGFVPGSGTSPSGLVASAAGQAERAAGAEIGEAVGERLGGQVAAGLRKRALTAAADSFTRLAEAATARRLAQATAPVVGAAFAAPDIWHGGEDIAHGNILLGAGTIGVALIDIAAQGLHATDEVTFGGGTALAFTIQAWCTAVQMAFASKRTELRATELDAYIQSHGGRLPPREQLGGYFGLGQEDILILENDIRKAGIVTTADVIARVRALLAEMDAAAGEQSAIDPAQVAEDRAALGRFLVALEGRVAEERAIAAKAEAAAAERARQARLDAALRAEKAAARPTPAQQAAANAALLPGPGPAPATPRPEALGPFLAPQAPRQLSAVTMENAELVATAFGRERDRLLAAHARLEAARFPGEQVQAFQAEVARYVAALEAQIRRFLAEGSGEWRGVQEMRRLRDAADNDDRSRLMR